MTSLSASIVVKYSHRSVNELRVSRNHFEIGKIEINRSLMSNGEVLVILFYDNWYTMMYFIDNMHNLRQCTYKMSQVWLVIMVCLGIEFTSVVATVFIYEMSYVALV